jgi:iron complex outermembrane receptor protein
MVLVVQQNYKPSAKKPGNPLLFPRIKALFCGFRVRIYTFDAALGCSLFGAEIIPIEPDPDHTGVGSVRILLSERKALVRKNSSMNTAPFLTLLLILTGLNFTTSAQIVVQGTISDAATEKSLPGALVSCEGTQFATASDNNGNFRLQLPSEKQSIRISFIGYETFEFSAYLKSDTTLSVRLKPSGILTDEIMVSAIRSGTGGMAASSLSKEEIKKLNTGQDVPYLLQLLPSVVVTSDAGNGIGYTGIRIRGTDQSRINVTINGIPLNDAESQQVYWVNLPDFASSVDNIQVQRGVGSSTNGSAAFGGSINLLSNQQTDQPYAEVTSGLGSFQSYRNTVQFSTGRMENNFAVDGRLSKITSNGYIDRGSSDLKSFYLGGSYADDKNLIRLNVFSGKEITYQSWYGVPESRYRDDEKGMQDYIDRNFLDAEEASNLLNSGRTYNYYTYDNQVDNYQQDHYQLHYARTLSKNTSFNMALHYTKGNGYFEEYQKEQSLANYGIEPVIVGSDTIFNSNLIRRKWLDNDFYGMVFGLTSKLNDKLNITAGGSVNRYQGDHYGEVIWAAYASNSEIRERYYENDATKDDRNIYIKADYAITKKLSLFGDLQLRNVAYAFVGADPDGVGIPDDVNLTFFNPKGGFTYFIGDGKEIYGSVAVGNKEPNRDDFTESTPASRPEHESMTDYEAGFRYNRDRAKLFINGFYMDYTDQLVLTGEVNDVGNATRVNVDKSYRMGLEIEAGFAVSRQFAIDMNATFSKNQIQSFTAYDDVYNANFDFTGQQATVFKNTPIAYSPAITSMGRLSWKFRENITAMLIGRYVGEQHLDNTGSKDRMMDDYFVTDFRLEYKFNVKSLQEIRLNLLLNNLMSTEYTSNGYTFGYIYDGQRVTENFYYPQALINYMAQLTIRF